MCPSINVFRGAKIKLTSFFDLNELYVHLHGWLTYDYKYDVEEKKYDEKTRGGGKDYIINWVAERKIDEYTKFRILVNWVLRRIKDVSVEKGGDKVKLQQGKIELTVETQLLTDYDNKWEDRPFYRFLRGFYEKYIYKDTIDRLNTQLWEEGWAFYNEAKSFLNLYKYTVEANPELA